MGTPDTWTPDQRSNAERWMACGFHLSQARLQLDQPDPSIEALRFHLNELYRQLALVEEPDAE